LNYKANDPRAQATHIRGLSEPDVPVGNRKQRMASEREKRSSEIPTSEWWTMRTMRWMLLLVVPDTWRPLKKQKNNNSRYRLI